MNKQNRTILNLVLLFTGVALVAWLLGKLSALLTFYLVSAFGPAYILFCVKLVGLLTVLLPAGFAGLALVKRFHTHLRVMAALDLSKVKV